VDDTKSALVERTLAKPDIHQQWQSAYRTTENDKFYDQAFDYIIRILCAPKNSTLLDVGCGTCAHAIRLANHGFIVEAVDFSENILRVAEANIKSKGLDAMIKTRREDLLKLPFKDESFTYVLCWGVLMHIVDLEKAISELARVIKSGGILIISEGNMHSLQSIVLRIMKLLLSNENLNMSKIPAGIEYWDNTTAGILLTREANIRFLIEKCRSHRLIVKRRVAGQFTETYNRTSSRIVKTLIHSINNVWFRYIKIPHLAFGNILICRKEP
jgi:ubiquinone/menaquinone biosynthesis C-methylase UbiE